MAEGLYTDFFATLVSLQIIQNILINERMDLPDVVTRCLEVRQCF